MSTVNKPWIKEDRRIKAVNHTEDMKLYHKKDIQESIDNSVVYYDTVPDNVLFEHSNTVPRIVVDPITTDAAVHKYGKNNEYTVLNFASYKYPGGGFIIGAIAQEEAICHVSDLYNVIGADKFSKYYENNRYKLENKKVNGTYENFAIYSPDIVFESDESDVFVNVITCPAPNMTNYVNTPEYNTKKETMKSRIKFIFDIASKHKCENLILGAFGCGVFKNNPEYVANIFKDMLTNGNYNFKNIVFAIPPGENYIIFNKVFSI